MAFNKMMVMLPVMLAARKLDAEDPNIVLTLRISYFGMQLIILCLVAYMYISSQKLADNSLVYVPPAPTPFEDPAAKKKYTQTSFASHVQKLAQSLIGSTLVGICMTAGLHFYKGMVVGLAIQSVMGPFTMYDNPLFKYFFLGDKKAFGQKRLDELEADAEIVDSDGNTVVINSRKKIADKKSEKSGSDSGKKALEDVILDTWDEGEKADLTVFLKALNQSNINYKTKTDNNKWTPLMVVCGLGVGVDGGLTDAMKKMKQMGADPCQTDSEGWNALHWSAFHGSAEAARFLLLPEEEGGYDGIKLGLHELKDKEGKTALEHAVHEKNDEVAAAINLALQREPKNDSDEGLRKRK